MARKPLLPILVALTLAAKAYAINPGLYVSAGMGWGDVHQTDISRTSMNNLIQGAIGRYYSVDYFRSHVSDSTGLAGRGALGYQFGQHWALELGYSKFSNVVPKAAAEITDFSTGLPGTVGAKGNLKTNAVDFMGKAILPLPLRVPFPCQLSVSAKLGLAMIQSYPNYVAGVDEDGTIYESSDNDTQRRWWPTFGAGIAYDFTPSVQAEIAWTRIQSIGDDERRIGSTDLVVAGLSLHFDTF